MTEEELKRELEKLTREQSELRQKAEELAQKMASRKGRKRREGTGRSARQKGQQGQTGQQGQQGSGQTGQSGQAVSPARLGPSGQSGDSKRMRDVSEEMRNAASELRRQDPGAGQRARQSRARKAAPAPAAARVGAARRNRQRAVGDMQLEARQLADAQRQIASELAKTGPGEAGKDAVRKLAGEQDRLADRATKLTDALKQQAAGRGAQGAQGAQGARGAQGAAGCGQRSRVLHRLRRQRRGCEGDRASAAVRANASKPPTRCARPPKSRRAGVATPRRDRPTIRAHRLRRNRSSRSALEKAADKLAAGDRHAGRRIAKAVASSARVRRNCANG